MADSQEWETVQKHFNIEKGIAEEAEDIARREGKKDYEVMREALAKHVREKKDDTLTQIIDVAPYDGVVREGDAVRRLEFTEMWDERTGEEVDSDTVSSGDTVRVIEPGNGYYDYYKFSVTNDGLFLCHQHVRAKLDVMREIVDRANKYSI